MNIMPSFKNNKFYASIFASLILAISITIITLSITLHINFEKIELNKISELNNDKLFQTSQGVDFMMTTAKALSRQVYYDSYIQKLFHYSSPQNEDLNAALNQIESYRTTAPFIDSIYVYNSIKGTFYTSSYSMDYTIVDRNSFYDKEIIDMLDSNSSRILTPIPRRLPARSSELQNNKQTNVYSFIFYEEINENGKFNSAVVINISEKWMNKIIGQMKDNINSTTIVLDNKNSIIFESDKKHQDIDSLISENFKGKGSKFKDASGYFTQELDGVKYFIVYSATDIYNWHYIYITPYSEITEEISVMRNKSMFFGLLILILGLLVSYFISNRFYSTVSSILIRIKRLETESRDNFYILKQEFLRKLLVELELNDEDTIRGEFNDYDIKIDIKEQVLMILIKIDNYKDFCDRYNLEYRNSIRFGIINMASELTSFGLNNEGIDMGEDSIILLANIPKDIYLKSDEIRNVLQNVQDQIYEKLKISTSVAVSTVTDTVNNLPMLYNQVSETILHRVFYGERAVIYSEDMNYLKSKAYTYPAQTEKQLINELMLGNIDTAKDLYLQILEYISQFPYAVVNLAFTHLVFNINASMETIQKNNFQSIDYSFNIATISLNKAENIEEINNEIFKVFENLSVKLEDKKNSKQEETMCKILEIIKENYSNTSLSIDYIADQINLTPTYLSRLFKKVTNKTILDSIVETRMEKARELLLHTNKSISEISEKTGFMNSPYFYKVFKKMNGVTPAEFRKNVLKNSGGIEA